MNLFLVYILLFKAVVTSFSGMSSLPMVRDDFVTKRHALTDRQLNTAIVGGRSGPGPNGLYLVGVGYFAAGTPGAIAGLLALITPAFLIIPLMNWIGRYANQSRIRGAIRAVILASAGLLIAASIPLTIDAVTGPFPAAVVAASFLVLTFTEVETWWVMVGAALAGLGSKLFG